MSSDADADAQMFLGPPTNPAAIIGQMLRQQQQAMEDDTRPEMVEYMRKKRERDAANTKFEAFWKEEEKRSIKRFRNKRAGARIEWMRTHPMPEMPKLPTIGCDCDRCTRMRAAAAE